jgi:hypothetical protein
MPNVNLRSQFHYSNAGAFTKLLVKVSIGAAGAPTIVSGTGMGITSITRVSAGKYTILLSNPYNSLLGVDSINRATAAPAAPVVCIATDTVTSATAPALQLQCYNNAGTATDPASGEVLYLAISLNRSSLSN